MDVSSRFAQQGSRQTPALMRSLTLAHATLYGLGVTIGAGIYVLVGAAAAQGGMHAPLAFIIAAVLMALYTEGVNCFAIASTTVRGQISLIRRVAWAPSNTGRCTSIRMMSG